MVESYGNRREYPIPGIRQKEGLYGKGKGSVDFWTEIWNYRFDYNSEENICSPALFTSH